MRLSRREALALLQVSFSAEVKLVNLFATVRDGNGSIVKDLKQDDFEVYEDERLQTIRYFSPETNVPLRLGLVVDISGSMARRVGDERDAARRFFRQVLRPEQDRAFLVRFDRGVDVLQRLTGLEKELDRAAGELGKLPGVLQGELRRPPEWVRCGGASSIRDAVFLSCDQILRKERGRKALILLSDGLDNGSCMALRAVVQVAHQTDTILYTLLFDDPQYGRAGAPPLPSGRALMEQLANRTGGRMFRPGIDTTVAKAFASIEEDLRNQYAIGYTSDRPSPGFHQLRVVAKGFTVQTREGYYGG